MIIVKHDDGALLRVGAMIADHCIIPIEHRPTPARFVLHHKCPEVCGGLTHPDNLVSVCDNHHMIAHRIMWLMRMGYLAPTATGAMIREIAFQGFTIARELGTVDRIPNEGGNLW